MSRLRDLMSRASGRTLGFELLETMRGTHRYLRDAPGGAAVAGAELPFEFTARWGAHRLPRFLTPGARSFLRARLRGEVTAGGLCEAAPITGTLELRYLTDATIRYAFEFEAQGRGWSYVGEKRGIRPWNLHRTHTTCYGTITDRETGEPLSESVVHFDLGQLPRFASSFRLTRG